MFGPILFVAAVAAATSVVWLVLALMRTAATENDDEWATRMQAKAKAGDQR